MIETAGAVPPPLVLPRYGSTTLADFSTSLLAALRVPGEPNALGLETLDRVCVLLVDGLGQEQLRAHPEEAPYLSSLLDDGQVLTVGFPATTATSLASLGTGRPPGVHGMLGYQVAIPGAGRLMNNLRWDSEIDPLTWQPQPTVYERAAGAGLTAAYVAPGEFAGSGLTVATARGVRYVPADSVGECVARAGVALRDGERSFVVVYYGDLDATGHRNGCRSAAWRYQLGHVDRLAEQLADGLSAGAALYVTADHGMVDVAPEGRVDAQAVPELQEGVALLGGEARARHVYARQGAAADVLAAWQELLGDRMWIASRQEAVAAGWFGSRVDDVMLPRIGDVVAAAHGPVAVTASRTEPAESQLVGLHGSMTADEQLVPLLRVAAPGG
ncbi:MAG: alkaline phosphatase family protein [Streptosporangiales bacterium]|nr:alkaline phosphatase family protein [Streptosporangiales bacterium]